MLSRDFGNRLLIVFATLAICTSDTLAQGNSPLAPLTVSENELPRGCRLTPADAKLGFVFPSNPWLGRNPQSLVALRNIIDGPLKIADGPPLSARQLSAFEYRWLESVVDGYRATYVSSEEDVVTVSAIRFTDVKAATVATIRPQFDSFSGPFQTFRQVTFGTAIVVVASTSESDCFLAIDAIIRKLK